MRANSLAWRMGTWSWLCWGAVSLAVAGDWPEFRGPTGQGHSDAVGLPVTWSPQENVRWRVAIPGQGWSSPAVVAGRIYLTAAVPLETSDGAPTPDYSLRALCLSADDGSVVWNQEVFVERMASGARVHAKNSHASPTPLVADGKVYVHFGHEGTACLDLRGEILWKSTELRYSPVHGNGGSPALVGDRLIFSCDGASDPCVVALACETGRVAWRTPRTAEVTKKFSFSTPLVIEVDGRPQVISPGSNMVAAYDPETGAELWKLAYDGYSVIPRPIFGHGLLYLSSGYDQPQVLAVRPGGQGDLTATNLAWSLKRGAPHTPSLILVGDYLYMVADRGIATCCDARSGEIQWQERLDGNFSASPVYAEGRIYFQSEEGVGYVIKASPQYELLAKNDLKERTLASYGIVDRALLIRTAQHLYRIEQAR